MEDLGSLIRFLRVEPFENNASFRKYILEPVLTDPEAGQRGLRLLLRSMCLRRTRVLLDIPTAKDETFTLTLSAEERTVYSRIIEDTRRKIDDCISCTSIAKAYSSIFHTILRLRLLCNQGTHRLLDSKSEDTNGLFEAGYVEGGKLACQYCSCEIIVADAQNDISPGASPQSSLHLLCPACLSPADLEKAGNQKRPTTSRGAKLFKMTDIGSPRSNGEDRVSSASLRPTFSPQGHSSKISALVSNLQRYKLSDKRYVNLLREYRA